jgi:hypothetical protein
MATCPAPHRRGACLALVAACFLATGPGQTQAHSGGLNAEGCHANRKTGDYHCHRAARPPQDAARPVPPIPSRTPGRYFRNCTEARAAGAAPLRIGEPGYAPHLDRDGDGIACEPYRGR